jgi:hypothetical protein
MVCSSLVVVECGIHLFMVEFSCFDELACGY